MRFADFGPSRSELSAKSGSDSAKPRSKFPTRQCRELNRPNRAVISLLAAEAANSAKPLVRFIAGYITLSYRAVCASKDLPRCLTACTATGYKGRRSANCRKQPCETVRRARSRRLPNSPGVPVFPNQLFSRWVGYTGPAGRRHGSDALKIGDQFGLARIRRLGQEVTQRLFQRFALRPRPRPRLQPIENLIVDVSNYRFSHTHAPATVIAL